MNLVPLAKLSSLVGAVALVQAGCMSQNEYAEQYDDSFEYLAPADEYAYQGNLEVLAGHMRGDVGGRNVDSDASLLTGYGDADYASVEVHAEGRDGAAMNLVDIFGGIDALSPGLQRTFSARDEVNYDALSVSVLNCAGDSRYAWDYDQPADEVEVAVSEGSEPGVLRVSYTARTFEQDPFTSLPTGRTSDVSGHFDVKQ